ncbi:hypothetical protein, partial [Bradyrhizobium ottawaense]
TKEEIEKFVFGRYAKAMNDRGTILATIVQNDQNHFDFTVTLPDGSKHYIDLVEFVLHARCGSPYMEAGGLISHKEAAEQLLETIRKKSDRYGKPGNTPIDLLVYTTHYRFLPSEPAVRLVQHSLQASPPMMSSVQFLSFRDQDLVRPRMLYPVIGDPLEGHAPESFQDLKYMNFDPANFDVVVKPDLPERS